LDALLGLDMEDGDVEMMCDPARVVGDFLKASLDLRFVTETMDDVLRWFLVSIFELVYCASITLARNCDVVP